MTSFAQNAEDVRLWRVFASKATGFYVDVGAGHPVNHSVTKLFYDAGWSGLNVEPGPDYALLAAARPRDTTVDVAISSRTRHAQMWVVSPYSELSSLVEPTNALPDGASARPVTVPAARLDDLVGEHARGRPIDFLKIDVEGAERDVLESFDPRVLRPNIVVVEAISSGDNCPTHDEWEFLLVRAGYVFAAFDGINRFYVAEDSADLISALAYPITVLDRYVVGNPAFAHTRNHEFLSEPESRLESQEIRQLQTALRVSTDALTTVQSTLSWRVTRPLRAIRRLQRRTSAARPTKTEQDPALASRLATSAHLLAGRSHALESAEPPSVHSALESIRGVLASETVRVDAAAWLLLTAVDGSYPRERDVENATQVLRTLGPEPFMRSLERRIGAATAAGGIAGNELEVLTDAVVVDVSQIASSGLHTGIQRVARECVSHWLRAGWPLRLSSYDRDTNTLRLLAEEEAERLQRWQDHLGAEGQLEKRRPRASRKILVPWSCDLVLTELTTPEHSTALRGLVVSDVHRSLCLVCYDLIPFVAPESVDSRMVNTFADYLAVLKYADRVTAISEQSAADVRAFTSMLQGQGLHGPEVAAHPLPTEVPTVAELDAERPLAKPARADPMVLVVGVHAPRKNHVVVLEAAERLWRRGHRFELVFMGGSMWRAEGYFDAYVERLQDEGRPIRVERRVSERALWDAYRRARFTVFPSLIEGFGLPVAESLAAGTPAITSNYGSMAEIAAGGGALTIDPRDVGDLEEQMRSLLGDDELLERLRLEAQRRDLGTWSDYADAVWGFFFPGHPRAA